MRNIAILVDGAFYLKRHKIYFKNNKEISQVVKDLQTQCLKHVNKEDNERLYRIFFYDCSPLLSKQHNPINKKSIDLSKTPISIFRNTLHSQLKQTRNFALRLGRLDETNGRWKIKNPKIFKQLISGKINYNQLSENDVSFYAQQKTVDMKIGLDIASLAYKKLVDKIVLISGDSDFVPAAKLARREGIEFVLDSMYVTITPELQEHIDGLNTTLPKLK